MHCVTCHFVCIFFFFNDTATTEIYTLSLHDALPISGEGAAAGPGRSSQGPRAVRPRADGAGHPVRVRRALDRKSTRLNSSHLVISYAVFCLKKKKNTNCIIQTTSCVIVETQIGTHYD